MGLRSLEWTLVGLYLVGSQGQEWLLSRHVGVWPPWPSASIVQAPAVPALAKCRELKPTISWWTPYTHTHTGSVKLQPPCFFRKHDLVQQFLTFHIKAFLQKKIRLKTQTHHLSSISLLSFHSKDHTMLDTPHSLSTCTLYTHTLYVTDNKWHTHKHSFIQFFMLSSYLSEYTQSIFFHHLV